MVSMGTKKNESIAMKNHKIKIGCNWNEKKIKIGWYGNVKNR